MTVQKVAIITGASRGIGAGLVAAYRGRGWAVVATARTIKPSRDPDLLAVAGDIADPVIRPAVAGSAISPPTASTSASSEGLIVRALATTAQPRPR